MFIRSTTKKISALLLLLVLYAHGFSATNCYPNPPSILEFWVDSTAKDIVAAGNGDTLRLGLPQLVFYSIVDATVGVPADVGADIEDYQFLGETARTDKQLGSSPKSSGSTSLVEKPGFATLLGFAVEHGAIQQAVDGTTLTLSTTPYALIALANKKDTAQLYQDAGLFNRIGASASFDISNKDNLLTNASRKQLQEWSVRVRLTGDKSSRSPEFIKFWNTTILDKLKDIYVANSDLDTVTVTIHGFARDVTNSLVDDTRTSSLVSKINSYISAHKSETDANKKVADIKELIYCGLKEEIYDPLKKKPDLIDPALQTAINNVVTKLRSAQANVNLAKSLLKGFIESFQKKPEATLAYINHRVAMTSDYSEAKLLFSADTTPLKLTANVGVSFYNHPDRMLNQEKVRDITAALAFEGGTKSPFTQPDDLSKITYTFSGSYQRLKENENVIGRRPDIASVQFKLEIPIFGGFSIPVSYTFSSASETSIKKENKFNIGLHLDVDKLYALTRLGHK
jgi:hypothetical protein